jgi:hypothetical protein
MHRWCSSALAELGGSSADPLMAETFAACADQYLTADSQAISRPCNCVKRRTGKFVCALAIGD